MLSIISAFLLAELARLRRAVQMFLHLFYISTYFVLRTKYVEM
jgi:hypothetical protein